ncbi:uncharacterized protein LOC136072204 isoform X2 [Hydra vulgaris]|uniref:uncharacterized protein LOC136072204 isoform X2 n=1 Tax=Hydra vulgaris TaxID=6087 RepID=UPI0032EA2249
MHTPHRLTNFLKLEVKLSRQIQKNLMQRLDINPSSFSLLQMVRSDTTITASWILRLEGGLLRPNSSPYKFFFLLALRFGKKPFALGC